MKLSSDHILTTHVGSLPRPPDLLALLEARETGREFDQAAFETRLAAAVRDIVAKQVKAGIDSVCDGELGKISYTTYIRHRFSSIGTYVGGDNDRPPQTAAHRDLLEITCSGSTKHGAAPRGSAAKRCRAARDRSPTAIDGHWRRT